jgi:hypothetical protein
VGSERTQMVEIWLARFGAVIYKDNKVIWEPMKLAILKNLNSFEGLQPLHTYGPSIIFPVVTASALSGAQYREFAIATCRLIGEKAIPPLIQLLNSIESYHDTFTSLYLPYHKLSAKQDASFAIKLARIIAIESLKEIIIIHNEIFRQFPDISRIIEQAEIDQMKWNARQEQQNKPRKENDSNDDALFKWAAWEYLNNINNK